MSESRHPCPLCERPVGGVHADECARSRATQARGRRLSYILKKVCRGNFTWVSIELATGPEIGKPAQFRDGAPVLYRSARKEPRRKGQRDEKFPQGRVIHGLIEMIEAANREDENAVQTDGD